jgi:hypothetical protein
MVENEGNNAKRWKENKRGKIVIRRIEIGEEDL